MDRYVLAIDPSGNFKEGKGTTGWCLYDSIKDKIIKFGTIKAKDYKQSEEYWQAHVDLVDSLQGYGLELVIEDYRLYANRALSQINSIFETPKLIGVLQTECYLRLIPVTLQSAAAVKKRWSDDMLIKKEILTYDNNKYELNGRSVTSHVRDAIRHAIHYKTFKKKGDKNE